MALLQMYSNRTILGTTSCTTSFPRNMCCAVTHSQLLFLHQICHDPVHYYFLHFKEETICCHKMNSARQSYIDTLASMLPLYTNFHQIKSCQKCLTFNLTLQYFFLFIAFPSMLCMLLKLVAKKSMPKKNSGVKRIKSIKKARKLSLSNKHTFFAPTRVGEKAKL